MSAPSEVTQLAQRFNLFEGKHADFYNLHGQWCLTKAGAEKVAESLGITHTMPECDITPVCIAYRAEFSTNEGGKAFVVGSCRWDGPHNNPEKTHAPEMAWKRMFVRGVIQLAAPSVLHGEDEFTAEFKQGGAAAAQQNQQTPMAPMEKQPPSSAPRSNGTASYADTGEGASHPNMAAASSAEGWFNGAEKLPGEWGALMGQFCELTGQARGEWEAKLMDHGGKFQMNNGNWYAPSGSFASFKDMVFATKEWQGQVKSRAKQALMLKKAVAEVVAQIDANGTTTLQVPEAGQIVEYTVGKRDMTRATTASQPAAFNPDDVPF
jgi:hypothetical protein